MVKKALIAAGLATLLVWVVSAQSDLKSVVDKSMKAMGVENVKTLTISGEGGDGAVGQPYSPFSDRWRWTASKNWVRSVDFDAKGWRVMKSRAVVGENAFGAERGSRQPRAVTAADSRKRFAQVGLAGDAAGDVAAGDEKVDQREKSVDARVEVIEVGDNRNARGARPTGGDGCGCGVVAVEMKCPGT